MAKFALILLLCQFSMFGFSCSGKVRQAASQPAEPSPLAKDSIPNSPKMISQITLQFTVTEKPPLAFGYVFECTVLPETATDFEQTSFLMSVLVRDKETLAQLRKATADQAFTGTFERYKEDVPNRVMAITGFVDAQKTAWKLVELK